MDGFGAVLPTVAGGPRRLRPGQAKVGTLQGRQGLFASKRPCGAKPRETASTRGPLVGASGEVQRVTARLASRRANECRADGSPEPDRKTQEHDLLPRDRRGADAAA